MSEQTTRATRPTTSATDLSPDALRVADEAYGLVRYSADRVRLSRLRAASAVWVFEAEPYELWAVLLDAGARPADLVTDPLCGAAGIGILKRFDRALSAPQAGPVWEGYADESGYQCVEVEPCDAVALRLWHERLIEAYGPAAQS